jgi:hypothetical protein
VNVTKALTDLFVSVKEWAQPAFDALAERVDEREAAIRKDMDAAFEKLSNEFGERIGLVVGVGGSISKEEVERLKEYWEAKFTGITPPQVTDADVCSMVEKSVTRAMESLELPKDGDPGKDAAQLDVLPRIEEGKSYARGSWATHNGGLWRAHATTDGMRGWECVVDGVRAFHVEQIDERNLVAVSQMASGKEQRQEFAMPAMIYKAVWKEGTYQKGDTVTWGGSLWHCDEDTDEKPGDASKCWTLCAKKGRDAK